MALPTSFQTALRAQRGSQDASQDAAEEGHGPQVYVTHMEDALYCGVHKIDFLRAAFGTCDDVIDSLLLRAEPFQADAELKNQDEMQGKIALVQRGSSTGLTCSFVEKAMRVQDAGAVAMVLINTEDSMISPGDSAREGGDVRIPVVGIRASHLSLLSESIEQGATASLTFKPVSPLRCAHPRQNRDACNAFMRGLDLTKAPAPCWLLTCELA